ncbi:F420-dependent oxidoreductase-like protein [Kibdelosporangium banguiense]|uniref:F420-dependent oxidoreductase-like protein n=1 Tax=Kibdelosporangium banguiense TaxID=1365924 RepID=A0ABS4TEW0_9PSEU|nr:LLM class F420-dependent oxidoreductase [Kibdelosporangium banguiense]MBP2322966.1 F420-dependent oxidoreductase-like protein [Kibdelosporangium banguiense]
MKISTQLMYAGDPKELIEQIVSLENAGLDAVWVAEAYGFDAPSLMGYVAAKTDRVQIGSAILPIYSRTPALLAQTAAGLDAVSGGRAILGLGASGPQVVEGWHGVAYDKPLGRTREIVDICRRIWRREVITNEGNYPIPLPAGQGTGLGKPLKILTRPVRDSIPIYIAALGDKNVQMTAEVADGWLPTLFIPEKAQDVWGPALAAGKAKRSAELGDLEIVAGGMLAIGDDVEALRDASRPVIALYVGGMGARGRNFYNDLARRYGYEAEAEKIQDLYLAGKKEEAAAAVPAEFAELMNLVGPASYVKERLQAFKEAGVTTLNVTPIGENPAKLVEQVKEWLA